MISPAPSRRAVDRVEDRSGEEGYLLLGLVVAGFLILLALSVAAPRVAKELERDREIESEHRALEYVRAIKLYYAKNNSYPTSVDQLLGSGGAGSPVSIGPAGNVKYLRQKYKDPLTNDEFRLIHLGEAQTQVKGFFGEPLQGMPTTIAGATPASNMNSSAAGTFGSTSAPGSSFGNSPSGASTTGASTTGATTGTGSTGTGTGTSATGTGSGTGTTGSSSPFGGNDASTFQGSKGAVIGVGSNAKGHGQVEWNGSENIEQWEFLYDPRVELLKAKVSLFGGSPAATGTGSISGTAGGSAFGSGTGATPGSGTGSSFGSGSSFGGSTTGTGTGSSTGTSGSTGNSTGGTGTTGTNGTNP